MRWTILMSTGDCFQAVDRAVISFAGAKKMTDQRAMEREDFLHYFEQVRERTMRVVSAIPEDKVEWTCRPDEWTSEIWHGILRRQNGMCLLNALSGGQAG